MQSIHTPGPWKSDEKTSQYPAGPLNVYSDGAHVCEVTNGTRNTRRGTTKEEAEANARLIAAAPEMFGVLSSVSMVSGLLDAIGPARWNAMAKALANAKGQRVNAYAGPDGIRAIDSRDDQVEGRAS